MDKTETIKEKTTNSAGIEVHIDGPETKVFVLWAANAEELEKVCSIAEKFKGVGL